MQPYHQRKLTGKYERPEWEIATTVMLTRTVKHRVDLPTFERILHQTYGDNQIVAAFAIGHMRSAWGRYLLRPFMLSNDPGVRWAAAFSLGETKDERARPVLVQML